MCESFFATLECELLDRNRFRSQVEARIALFQFIEGWYNPIVCTPGSALSSSVEQAPSCSSFQSTSIEVKKPPSGTEGGKIPLGLPLVNQDRFHRRHEEEDQERRPNPSP
jgi:hypothetical protein